MYRCVGREIQIITARPNNIRSYGKGCSVGYKLLYLPDTTFFAKINVEVRILQIFVSDNANTTIFKIM